MFPPVLGEVFESKTEWIPQNYYLVWKIKAVNQNQTKQKQIISFSKMHLNGIGNFEVRHDYFNNSFSLLAI